MTAKESIMASFVKLLEERPLREITVKDIVQDCGVNRNSFYYHFKDIPALLEEIITDYADHIIADQGDSLAGCLNAAARFAQERRQLLTHINQSAHRHHFELCLMNVCRRVVERYAAAAFDRVPIRAEDREVLVRFYQCEFFGQIMEWLNSGMRYDIGRQFQRLCQLADGVTKLMLERAMEPEEST